MSLSERGNSYSLRWDTLDVRNGRHTVLTLRALVQSGRWRQAWPLIEAQFRVPVSIVKEQLTHQLQQDTASHVKSWSAVSSHFGSSLSAA